MSANEKSAMLGFVWGRSRLPERLDLQTRFRIDEGSGGDQHFPKSHTCSFQLHLPQYSTEEVMRDKLMTVASMQGAQSR